MANCSACASTQMPPRCQIEPATGRAWSAFDQAAAFDLDSGDRTHRRVRSTAIRSRRRSPQALETAGRAPAPAPQQRVGSLDIGEADGVRGGDISERAFWPVPVRDFARAAARLWACRALRGASFKGVLAVIRPAVEHGAIIEAVHRRR